jgi:thymidine kinase
MFSGKTTELLRSLNRSRIAGKKVVLIRPNTDTRTKLTHDHLEHNLDELRTNTPRSLKGITDYDVIGLDEGQFFKDLKIFADLHANMGRTIIIAALNGTSERKPFEQVQDLIPFVEDITMLNAVCINCGSEYGSFSFYTAGVKDDDILVGDQDTYTALCRDCYIIGKIKDS